MQRARGYHKLTSKNDAIHEWDWEGRATAFIEYLDPHCQPRSFQLLAHHVSLSDDPDSRVPHVWPHRCHIFENRSRVERA